MKEFLPAMKTDIMLSKYGKTLIIDATYYGNSMQVNSLNNSRTLISTNLYQFITYVKNMITQKSKFLKRDGRHTLKNSSD